MNQAELLQLTDQLLTLETAVSADPRKVMEDLQRVINLHDRKYYVDSNPLITDYDYDVLFKKLKALEEANPSLISSPSIPLPRVAARTKRSFS